MTLVYFISIHFYLIQTRIKFLLETVWYIWILYKLAAETIFILSFLSIHNYQNNIFKIIFILQIISALIQILDVFIIYVIFL